MATIISHTSTGYYNSVNGKVHIGERMGFTWNTGPIEYWNAFNMFGNMLDRVGGAGTQSGTPEPADADGWYDCRSGAQVQWWIYSVTYYPVYGTSKVVVTWVDKFPATPSNVTLAIYTGVTFLPGESSANRNVYSIVETGDSGLRVRQTNGYAIDVKVFMESDEPGIIAGRVASDQYISDVGGAKWIRWMDAMRTNNSGVVDWDEYLRTDRGNRQYMKLEHIAKISNETGVPPWICFPTMGTDACWASMCAELNTYLNPGTRIRAELGNEIWNYGFKNNAEFLARLDAPLIESDSFDGSTGLITKTAHGNNTGEKVNLFTLRETWSWKYGKGSEARVMKMDNDNFKICDPTFYYTTIAGVSKASTAVVTQPLHPHPNDHVIFLYRFDVGMVELEDVEVMVKNAERDSGTHNGVDNQLVLVDTTKSWTPGQWIGYSLRNLTNKNGKSKPAYEIASNTDTTITLVSGSPDWDAGNSYVILDDTYDIWDKDGIAPIDSTLFGDFTQGRVLYDLYDSLGPYYDSGKKTTSSQLKVRYKRQKDSTNWNPDGYGRRSVELWAICDAEFGRDRVEAMLCEQTQIDGDMRVALSRPGCRERFDVIATAPYFRLSNTDDGVTPIPGGWQFATIEECTDYIIDNDFPSEGRPDRLDGIKRMINDAAYCYRMCTYEGGDHTTTSDNSTQMLKHWEWTSSVVNGPSGIPAMQRCYEAYYLRLKELGIIDHGIYTMCGDPQQPTKSVPWGTMKMTGDTDTPKYIAFKTFDDEGGVP